MVKKFAKLPDLSASPETSSMTIKLIKYIISTHYNINTIIYVSLSLKKCNVHIKLVLESTRCRKHDKMFFSVSAETGIFNIQSISFSFSKILFFCEFLYKRCFSTTGLPNNEDYCFHIFRRSCSPHPKPFKLTISCVLKNKLFFLNKFFLLIQWKVIRHNRQYVVAPFVLFWHFVFFL